MKTLQLQKGVKKPLITLFVLFLMGMTMNKALAQCPTTAPPLTATTISNVCPVSTVNLTTLHTATVPAGSVLRWYKDDIHTTLVTNPTTAPGGTYYAFYYGPGNCYSPASVPVIATTECCLANTPPVLSSYSVSNVCPIFTVNLNPLYTGVLPPGITLRWFTNGDGLGSPYTTPGTAGEGTYYAYFYNAGAACYSPASLPVTVTIQCCGSIAAPLLTGNSLSNTCPGTGTVSLNSLHTGLIPSGTQLRWYNNNAHVGNYVSTPAAWNMGGTYYAYYDNNTRGCYSQPSAPVTVSITACTGSCAGITSPALSAVYATITCPSSTYDLNSLHTGVIPPGYQLQWRVVGGTTIVPDPSKAGAGFYRVRYFNPTLNCGGPEVSVTIDIDHFSCPLDPVVNNINGRYEITANAIGYNSNGVVTIPKPAGATTIHSVWAYTASVNNNNVVGYFQRPVATPAENAALNAVTINGTPAPWTNWADSWTDNPPLTPLVNLGCFVRYGEMSALLAGTLNAAAPGSTVDITTSVAPPVPGATLIGVGIIVVWNNPTRPVGSHLVLLGSIPTGKLARVELNTAPIDKTVPGFNPVLGASIVWSGDTELAPVKIGESEAKKIVSNSCGGNDDGYFITLGGYQDDPLLDPTDELYNVAPFLEQGQTHIRIDIQDVTINSNDFLAAIYFTGAGIAGPCSAGTSAPQLSTNTATNVCPATTVNLDPLHTGVTPAGATLVWYTNNTHTGPIYATPTAATAGTYYAFYYDAANDCYSPGTAPVTVTITSCCPLTSGPAPTLSSNTATNVCPATTVNLDALHTGVLPPLATLVWFTNNTHTGTAYATPTAATAGTYFAFYVDNTSGSCYSPASSAVTVTINTCGGGTPDLTPSMDIDGISFLNGEGKDFVINIFEILNNPTIVAGQPVIFRLNRPSGWDITVPGITLTGAPQSGIAGTSGVFGGTPNQNDKWLFSQNAGFITITLKPGEFIPGGGSMQIGFRATRKAGTSNSTVQALTGTIINGAGGETEFSNNQVVTNLIAN